MRKSWRDKAVAKSVRDGIKDQEQKDIVRRELFQDEELCSTLLSSETDAFLQAASAKAASKKTCCSSESLLLCVSLKDLGSLFRGRFLGRSFREVLFSTMTIGCLFKTWCGVGTVAARGGPKDGLPFITGAASLSLGGMPRGLPGGSSFVET